jgi:hypothetical protein
MSKQKNVRTLSEIADAIHSLERANVFDKGDLLIEAKEQGCERGEWLDWLDAEFEWSVDTAERYMKVAKLAGQFRNLRNLKLGRTTLYRLVDYEYEDDLPAIIKELAKHATKTRLAPRDAEQVIKMSLARHHFGDHPDATLVQLMQVAEWRRVYDEPWHDKAVAALQQQQPETEEAARAIVDEIQQEYDEAARKVQEAKEKAREAELERLLKGDGEAKAEAGSILDGAPPVLPPPTTPPEPQTLRADTAWEGRQAFMDAVKDLLELSTKPAARFAGQFSPERLREVSDFLVAVATADKKEAA